MEEILKPLEEERKKTYKTYCITILISIIFMIGFLALGIFVHPILIVVGIIVPTIGFCVSTAKVKKFSDSFKKKIIQSLVDEQIPGAVYTANGGVNINDVMEPGFFKKPDKFFSEDLLAGVYKDVKFSASDVRLQERQVTVDSKGHRQVRYVPYFTGRFMIFDYKRDLNIIVKILETANLGARTDGLEKVETESIAFSEKFKVFCSDPLHAFYVLTPQIQEKMLEMEKMFRGSIFYAFLNGKMYLAINDNSDSFDIKINKPINVAFIGKINGQINLCPAVIEEFSLDSSKFNDINKDANI